ncbi:MAG: sensor domain-containing diguanylate cyclase [Desulfocapsaceae bacterium]|nr:sensor domain-containing diguanylate cyclase [Desulfocapsaceae bacterium]
MKHVFEDLPLPAIHLDAQTRILKANNHASELFTWQTFPAEPTYFTQFLPIEEIASFTAFYEKIATGLATVYNTTICLPGEVEAQVNIKASLTSNDNRIFLLNKQDAWKAGCDQSCRHAAVLEAQYQQNPGGILLVNGDMEMISFNQEFINIWEIPPEVQKSRDEKASLQSILGKLVKPEEFIARVEYLYKHPHESDTDEVQLKDGRTLYRHTYPIYSQGEYLGRVWYFLDITTLKQAQHQLEKQQIFQQAILEHIQDGIVATNEKGEVSLANRASRRLYGIEETNLLTDLYTDRNYYHTDGITPLAPTEDPLKKVLVGKNLDNDEIVFIDGQRKEHTLRVNGQAMYDGDGQKIGAFISMHDITDLRAAEEKLRYFANHDQLTGLPNRRLFHDLLEQTLKQAHRHDFYVGVLFLDLDDFKAVNDQYGHHIGDQLLREVACTLKNCLRDSDILCRWGGDEFIIGLPASKDNAGIINVAEKICTEVLRCIKEQDKNFEVSVSIGISISPTHGMEPDLLIRNADIAMYRAKRSGKNKCELFSRDL